ncbi:MAG: di/tricarboxylate transporter [Planctomycetota bacterium]|jgi:di/tricarboxylate transporter
MTPEQIWVLAVLFGTLVLLVTEVLTPGITGLLAIGALVLGNLLFPDLVAPNNQAFAGLVNPAVIAVGSMFVISAGITRTGAIGLLVNRFLPEGRESKRHYIILLMIVLVGSAFMNNTPLVLIFMPVMLGLATKLKKAPSKMLIPLSFVSIMGGMCTKIGTSTNIVVAAAVEEHFELQMFDFFPMGIILATAGVLFILFFGDKLLPSRASLGLGSNMQAEYMTEMEIVKGSVFVDKKIKDFLPQHGAVRVLQHIRNDVIHAADPEKVLESGDLLLIKGDPAAIMQMHLSGETGVMRTVNVAQEEEKATNTRRVAMSLVEVIVKPGSRWVGRRVRDVGFRERYGVGIFAVQRHGSHLREKVEDLRLNAGDILLVQGPVKNLQNLKMSDAFFVVEGVDAHITHTMKAPVALFGVTTFLAIAIFMPAQVHVAALLSALIMVVGRCLTANEAYASLDWDVLFLLGGTMSLGLAFDRTGLAASIAENIVTLTSPYGERVALCGIFCFTALITQVLSNNAAAAVMTPLAYAAGMQFALAENPLAAPEAAMPYVMAVAFGASCCFLTPIGYGTNLIVYGPGGYRFKDFLKLGLPLTLIFSILATILLPIIYS